MSFITGTQCELLYSLQTAVTKNTYTTEAPFSGVAGTNPLCSLPAGYFASENPNPVGRGLYLVCKGTIATTSAATLAVNLGFDSAANTKANSVTVMAATAPVASITATWSLEAWYVCTAFVTTQMTLQVNGTMRMEGAAAGAAAVSTALCTGFQGSISGATMDPRVQYYIELFGTWSASAAGNTTTLQQMLLFGLN